MDVLKAMRAKVGPRVTTGLTDNVIEKFLVSDISLSRAILNAKAVFDALDGPSTYCKDEGALIKEMQVGFCHLYPADSRNPYIPIAAKGPWIITMHAAVVHDNGGYGMLGLGHSPDVVLKAMGEDHVMANVMTAALPQQKFLSAIRKEIGHSRKGGCPYSSFVLMNSGSEGNSVADRLIDIHTGTVMAKEGAGKRKVKCIAMKGAFHGRTYRPALWTDACKDRYNSAGVYSIMQTYKDEYCWTCEVNNCKDLERLFAKAKAENVFIESLMLEPVMGEGNPGMAITREFYSLARKLTLEHDTMLLIDSIQAGLRCGGCLSITDYEGFSDLPEPDFEVYSKAINGGQFPVSCIALSKRGEESYRHGVYGNTMTGNPRACSVAAAVLGTIDDSLRKNIREMGKYAVSEYKKLQAEYPDLITEVNGKGLLYSVGLNDRVFAVVSDSDDGAEYQLRTQGLGVIHGGHNALRFTPYFRITKEEMDMQIQFVRELCKRGRSKGAKSAL